MKKTFFIPLLLLGACLHAQTVINLYDRVIPNSIPGKNEEKWDSTDGFKFYSKVSIPTLTVFLPSKEKNTGAAVVICPGGGYWVVAADHEGNRVAQRFVENGIAAFVVKYRLPDDKIMPNKEIGPLQDAQRAIQIVRQRAAEWGLDPSRIGLMGFSAGGHLASTAGTHFSKAYIDNPTNTSLRPDFLMLIYPVISFSDRIGHTGSRDQLIGKAPSAEKIKTYSNEEQVTPQTPPTFLVHATDDDVVKVENSIDFYGALIKNKVAAEMHIYEKGGHGYGLNNKTTSEDWMEACLQWIRANGWVKSQK
jgi:acetyl esterase/lipase